MHTLEEQGQRRRCVVRYGLSVAMASILLWPAHETIVGTGPAKAQELAGSVYVSPPIDPLAVTLDQKQIEAERPPIGPPRTVPEGVPITEPPPPKSPTADPTVQIETWDDPALPNGSETGEYVEDNELLGDPIQNFAGLTSFSNPPDTVHDVGPNHVVQMVNATQFQVFDKVGNSLLGPATFGNLWPVSDICRSSTGDPIVVYDHLADRFLLSQFAFPNHMCIAISQTPDPTAGSWFISTINVLNFPDYPKFGVWPDGYYMTSFEFPNLGIYVFDRQAMLIGASSMFFKTTIPNLGAAGVRATRILPSDLDGPPPPDGTPNFFVRTVDDQQDTGDPRDRVEVYEASVDFTAGTFTFTLVDDIDASSSPALAPFDIMTCNRNGRGIRDCIPQPVTEDTIDALSNRAMMQAKFRVLDRDGADPAFRFVFNQTIDVQGSIFPSTGITPTGEVAGIRWYELTRDVSGALPPWTIRQQGTFAVQPATAFDESDLLHRWMGSAAIDRFGNIALGYSIVNSNDTSPVFPGIRYTGRKFDDPLGLLQDEKTIRDGVNAQGDTDGIVETRRWGDYSAMTVDPTDDCTFWYTTHVAGTGIGLVGKGPRPTQIASFTLDSCVALELAKAKTKCGRSGDHLRIGGLLEGFDPTMDALRVQISGAPDIFGPVDVTLLSTDFSPDGSKFVAEVNFPPKVKVSLDGTKFQINVDDASGLNRCEGDDQATLFLTLNGTEQAIVLTRDKKGVKYHQ